MRIIRTVKEMSAVAKLIKLEGKRIGFVPTMGYLHEGHLSLMRIARNKCDVLVASIFVNPTQFGPNEDLDAYPRDFARDEKLCENENVDILFYPEAEDVYPEGFLTEVRVKELSERYCGASRPGHFAGVATVVAKLFNIVKPNIAVFGQKDAQQAVVIRRMAADLNFDVEIVLGEIAREADGLAMSSRNKYLSARDRETAPVLYRALSEAKSAIEAGEMADAEDVIELIRSKILSAGDFRIDYIAVAAPDSLEPVEKIEGRVLILLAAKIGSTRLIDNIVVGPAN
ncbi:MAG: pantoate--beta-alanine ligase [bacterium]